ncbi:hypothetical protein FRC00_013540 [Tulasnella sp. 408]|nr:hypothetical protein FRC00_013540 [Tulasnella sp. 408]
MEWASDFNKWTTKSVSRGIIRPRGQQVNEQRVAAQAASWLLQTTSNHGDQVAAAWFLRSINRNASATDFEDSRNWRRLLFLTRDALDVLESQPSDGNLELAEVFGLALCSMPLPFPKDVLEGEREKAFDSRHQQASSLGEAFLQTLELARAKNEGGDEESIFHLALLSTFLSKRRMIKEYQWANLSKLFLVDQNPRPLIADNLLGIWAYAVWLQGHPQFERNAALAYSACLRRARELARETSNDDIDYAAVGVARLVLEYFDQMTAPDAGHTPVELVKLSKEAVLGLRDFIDTKASENGSSVVEISESEQLFDHHAVAVVADILMWDSDVSLGFGPRAGSVKPSIVKILLWIWKNVSEVSMSDQERRKIFLSSCRLWAPLEKQVELSRTGGVRRRGDYDRDPKPLTPDDLKRITEFIDYIREDRDTSEFISRNADVGINRLYLPFDQGVDWTYELFDFCEPRRLCCRPLYLESELL